jgi:predicted permease
MTATKLAAWYGIGVGGLMLAQWGFFLSTGSVPELHSEPLRIGFHMFGELATAVGLIAAGAALLASRRWGRPLFLVAAGMVIYSEIVSPGYFAQRGQWGLVAMFAVLLVLAVLSVVALATDKSGSR